MRRALGFSLVLMALPALVAACPTCKDAFSQNPEGMGFARGIYLTVALLLGVLFSLVGFFIYKINRLAKQDAAQAAVSPKA